MDEEMELDVFLTKVHQQFRELDALTLKIFPDAVKQGFLSQEDAVAARALLAQHILAQQGACEKHVTPAAGIDNYAPESTDELGMFESTVVDQDRSRAFTPVPQCSNPCAGSPAPFLSFSRECSVVCFSSPARSMRFGREDSVSTWQSPYKVI
jgi:hypothetical protein